MLLNPASPLSVPCLPSITFLSFYWLLPVSVTSFSSLITLANSSPFLMMATLYMLHARYPTKHFTPRLALMFAHKSGRTHFHIHSTVTPVKCRETAQTRQPSHPVRCVKPRMPSYCHPGWASSVHRPAGYNLTPLFLSDLTHDSRPQNVILWLGHPIAPFVVAPLILISFFSFVLELDRTLSLHNFHSYHVALHSYHPFKSVWFLQMSELVKEAEEVFRYHLPAFQFVTFCLWKSKQSFSLPAASTLTFVCIVFALSNS